MHADVGAIIGISLAGSVLVVALLFLCIMHLPWPCCKNEARQSRTGNGNRRPERPSTSSRFAFANFDNHRSTRSINHLSAVDLHNQNQPHYYSSTGIVNPIWQMHCTCHSAPILTASQQNLNFSHCHPANSCQFPHQHHHVQQVSRSHIADTDHSANATEPSGFQYFSPQLQPPTDSPPPYPGSNADATLESTNQCDIVNSSSSTGPPPYSPKTMTFS